MSPLCRTTTSVGRRCIWSADGRGPSLREQLQEVEEEAARMLRRAQAAEAQADRLREALEGERSARRVTEEELKAEERRRTAPLFACS